MIGVPLRDGADIDGFRAAVRMLAARKAVPESVSWCKAGEGDLFGEGRVEAAPPVGLPRALGELIQQVVCHSDRERYALLYTAIWRVLNGERTLLEVQSDPLVHRLEGMAKSVRRDLHKMHAFVRFRETHDPDGTERFVSWFEPQHFIVEATAGFFVERFRSLVWSILTPVGSLHWDRASLDRRPARAA